MKTTLKWIAGIAVLTGLVTLCVLVNNYKENEYVSPGTQKFVATQIQDAMHTYVTASAEGPIFGATLPIAGQTYNLSGAGVSASQTTVTLASFTVTQTGQKIIDSDLSTTFYITLEPGNPTKQEIVSCTTVVQNANGSATLSGCSRGLSPITPYTASTTLRFSHGGGTQVIFSNPPQFYNSFAALDNANTFTAQQTFSISPFLTTDCTGGSPNNAICAKAYIDSVAVAGASNANETTKGIVELATNIEQASSTSLGSTGASVVLQAKYATSSPGTAGLWTVVTNNAGKIAQAFLDLSQAYTWTGAHIFNSTATFNGAVTLNSTATINGVSLAPRFGGTGVDGALTLTSGTTTVSLGGASYFEKDYTSVSITGTGHLAFSNPAAGGTFIVIKSQGGATITCSPAPCIDVSGMGSAGGTHAGTTANNGTTATAFFYIPSGAGGGANNVTPNAGTAGAATSAFTLPTTLPATSTLMKYGDFFWVGAGGGGGPDASAGVAGTDGGRGGGGLLLEVAGAWNFTTANGISATGITPPNPGNSLSCGTSAGGGGGGGGGYVKVLYNTLTANSGTINTSGGIGANKDGVCTASTGGGGGGGSGPTAGIVGTTATTINAKVGGNGATGVSNVEKNNDFY